MQGADVCRRDAWRRGAGSYLHPRRSFAEEGKGGEREIGECRGARGEKKWLKMVLFGVCGGGFVCGCHEDGGETDGTWRRRIKSVFNED